MGQNLKATKMYDETILLMEKDGQTKSRIYLDLIKNRMLISINQNEVNVSATCIEKVLDLAKDEEFAKNLKSSLMSILFNGVQVYNMLGMYEKSDSLNEISFPYLKEQYETKLPGEWSKLLINNSKNLLTKSRIQEAYTNAVLGYDVFTSNLGRFDIYKLNALSFIMLSLNRLNQPDEHQALTYLNQGIEVANNNIRFVISNSTEKISNQRLKKIHDHIYGVFFDIIKNKEKFSIHFMDSVYSLYSTFLINNEKLGLISAGVLREQYRKSITKDQQKLFDNWLTNCNVISNLMSSPKSKENESLIDSLLQDIENLERGLKTNARNVDILDVLSNKKIQVGLKNREALICIKRNNIYGKGKHPQNPKIDFLGEQDSAMYVYSIFTKNEVIHEHAIFSHNDEEKSVTGYYNSLNSYPNNGHDTYSLLLKPVIKHLQNVNCLYIINDGIYHKINLNTLLNPQTQKYVIDELPITYVSNLRHWLSRKDESPKAFDTKTAVLFGKPNFNLNATERGKVKYHSNKEVSSNNLPANPKLSDSLTRAGFSDLPESKIEVQSIAGLLNDQGWKTKVYLENEALEEAAKNVESPKILHFATHGYVLGKNAFKNHVDLDPLMRTGLLFAGANALHKDTSNKYDDGFLNGYEASLLNLSNTDLVVLSACETGLGDIQSGEGVIGLQRSFHIAGAKKIIMSLWKVNDKSSRHLMELFYKEWLSGKNYDEALRSAQMTMKANPAYGSPKHWGAFILAE